MFLRDRTPRRTGFRPVSWTTRESHPVAPIDPCGMICDFLRSCKTHKVYWDEARSKTSNIIWYFADPGAKLLPVPNLFSSETWDQCHWYGGPIGEDWNANPQYYNGKSPGNFPGLKPCGPLSWFTHGVPSNATPLVHAPDGLPSCCTRILGGCSCWSGFQTNTFRGTGCWCSAGSENAYLGTGCWCSAGSIQTLGGCWCSAGHKVSPTSTGCWCSAGSVGPGPSLGGCWCSAGMETSANAGRGCWCSAGGVGPAPSLGGCWCSAGGVGPAPSLGGCSCSTGSDAGSGRAYSTAFIKAYG